MVSTTEEIVGGCYCITLLVRVPPLRRKAEIGAVAFTSRALTEGVSFLAAWKNCIVWYLKSGLAPGARGVVALGLECISMELPVPPARRGEPVAPNLATFTGFLTMAPRMWAL